MAVQASKTSSTAFARLTPCRFEGQGEYKLNGQVADRPLCEQDRLRSVQAEGFDAKNPRGRPHQWAVRGLSSDGAVNEHYSALKELTLTREPYSPEVGWGRNRCNLSWRL